MRTARGIRLLFVLALVLYSAQAANPRRPRQRPRLVTRSSLLRSAGVAAFGQVRNRPHEWGRGPVGYVKRFGSAVGTHVAKEGIQFGVGAIHPENLHYQRSNRKGTWPRLQHAVKTTFIVPRKNRPGKTVALSRISGSLGSGMVSRLWQPASAAGIGAGLTTGGIAIGADVGANVAREFWPRNQHHSRRARRR